MNRNAVITICLLSFIGGLTWATLGPPVLPRKQSATEIKGATLLKTIAPASVVVPVEKFAVLRLPTNRCYWMILVKDNLNDSWKLNRWVMNGESSIIVSNRFVVAEGVPWQKYLATRKQL